MQAVGVGGAGVAALVTAVENKLPEVSDGRGAADGTTGSVTAWSDEAGIAANSEPSSLHSLAAAGAVGDAPIADTFNRDGISNVGLDSAVSAPDPRRSDAVADGESSISTARANGFPKVAGFKILLWFWDVPEEANPVPIKDGRSSGFDDEPLQSDASTTTNL